ncbi:MAG: hypothetical protein AAFN30_10450, partial [Actinomycetota bacterium]
GRRQPTGAAAADHPGQGPGDHGGQPQPIEGRPGVVVALDGLWLAAVVAGTLAGAVGSRSAGGLASTGTVVVLAWLAGGWASALLGHRLLRPSLPGTVSAAGAAIEGLDRHRSLSASQILLAIDSQALPSAVAALAGPAAGGGMRAGVLPFLPLSTALGALRVLALPRLRSRARSGGLGRATAAVAVGFAAIAFGLSVPILLLLATVPDAWLGPTGRMVAPWFPAGAAIVAGRMVGLVPADAVALGAGPTVAVRHRLLTSALDWAAALGALALWGLGPAFWARAGAVWCGVAWWSWALRRHHGGGRSWVTEVETGTAANRNPLGVTPTP